MNQTPEVLPEDRDTVIQEKEKDCLEIEEIILMEYETNRDTASNKLAIAVESKITLQSEHGVGRTFKVLMPINADETVRQDASSQNCGESIFKHIQCVIREQDDDHVVDAVVF